MGRREGRAPRRDDGPPRKGGGLFAGVLIGLTLGIVLAATVAWQLNMGNFGKPAAAETRKDMPPPVRQAQPPAPAPPQSAQVEPARREAPATAPVEPSVKPAEQTPSKPKRISAVAQTTPPPKPRVHYTFYGILPGDKPVRPIDPPPSKDVWWLQIAALSDVAKAEQIRARLAQLKLPARLQKIESNGQLLYRIRVGPYTREDDAFGDLDVLTENNFYARLLKEPADSQ